MPELMRSCPHCKTPYTSAVEFCGIDGQRLIETESDPLVGAVIDRYRVVERLGGGGMGAVYRAVHTVIDRQCALKVLFGELASDRAFADRFRLEAQTASKIKHDSVVEVLDFGTTPEGASFLLMELLEGETLADLLTKKGALSPSDAAWIARDVAAGLTAAHALGFIHRDLKPANVMLVADAARANNCRAKILDFGLASSMKKDDGKRALTNTGQTLGTPSYMAPEQIEGRAATGATDLYALGVMIHEMLAGARPFEGSLSDVINQQLTRPPPPLAPADGLEGLVAWLLEKDPALRPDSAVTVVREIERLALLDDAPPLVLATPATASAAPSVASTSTSSPVVAAPTRSDRHSAEHLSQPAHAASELFPSAAAEVSPEVRRAAAALTEAHVLPSAPSARVPSTSLATASVSAPARFPRSLVVASLALVVALVLVTFGADLGGLRTWLVPIHAAAEKVGAQAVRAALDEPVAPVAPAFDPADLERDITAALESRGLARVDVDRIADLRATRAQFDEAIASGDALRARVAASAFIKEIARAPISARVVTDRIARVADRIHASALSAKQRAQFEERLAVLRKRASTQRTESERGRIVLDAAALERELP